MSEPGEGPAGGTILVTGDDLHENAVDLLTRSGFRCVMSGHLASAERKRDLAHEHRVVAMIVRIGPITPALMDASDRLQVIAKHGVGYDDVDLPAATERGIPVLVTRGANALSVAEHALAMMLTLVKKMPRHHGDLSTGLWRQGDWLGSDLTGRCLGLVGLGAIARELVALARPFQLRLLAYDPYTDPPAVPEGVALVDSLDDVLGQADVISVHTPLTEETRGLIGEAALARMKPTAVLINTARGPIVDEVAVAAALKEGRLAGAGIDCFPQEPIAAENPLIGAPNVLLTPHVAGVTADAARRMGAMAAENVLDVLLGRPVNSENLINPEVLS